jgi:hypothetical protein
MEDFACSCSEHSVIPFWILNYSVMNTQLFCSECSVILFWPLSYSVLNAPLFCSERSVILVSTQLFGAYPSVILVSTQVFFYMRYFVLPPGVHYIPLVLLLVWQHRPRGRRPPWARAPCDGEVGYDGGVMQGANGLDCWAHWTEHCWARWNAVTANCFRDLFKRNGELASRLVYSLASGAMGALREHAFVDELKNGRLPWSWCTHH